MRSLLIVLALFGGFFTTELSSVLAAAPRTLGEMVGKDEQDRAVYRAVPMGQRFKNPVDPAWEREFQQRARGIVEKQSALRVPAGNTYFENEKRSYGLLMAQVLGGRREAIADLQREDAQAKEWHRETSGIDYYACFTLKHQTRKYFYFGDLLEPAYRERMLAGAKAWTSQDPLRRPHYAFKAPGPGWGPDAKNSWVDVRTTENLYLMRVSSIYLFAEAAGNRDVVGQYKAELSRYAKALYRVGMGEWDSENYHGHSIAPLANLYDFAQDEEVRLLAKACLDWAFATGAVKYYRGGFNGPTKRDYNHAQPFGGSAASMLWVAFGDCPIDNTRWESDEVHLITSNYRPPSAVIALARKQFDRPIELWSAKPHYTASTTGDFRSPPAYLETQYFGNTFQLGSLAVGTSEDGGDVNGFKMLVFSERRGAEALQCVPGDDALFPGSPKYEKGKVSGPNRVAQFGNLAIWLARDGRSPWRFVVPQSVKVSEVDGVTFLECDRTWVAIRMLAAPPFRFDEAQTRRISTGENVEFHGHQVLATAGNSPLFCGFAIEVGESASHGGFAEFKKKALAAKLDATKLATGVVEYAAADGRRLEIRWHDDPRQLGVFRDGQPHDWHAHAQWLYRAAGDAAAPDVAPLSAKWGQGELRVQAGGRRFRCTVRDDGAVSFENH